MSKQETLDVGVIVERRDVDHPWLDVEWVPVAAVPGAPALAEWTSLEKGEGWTRYHAATMPLVMHRQEASAYAHNLQTGRPSVYVILRESDDADSAIPVRVSLATVNPYEAQDYMDSGEENVATVPMPDQVRAWVANFVAEHHVEEKFVKRRRDRVKIEEHKFGQEPLYELKRRMKQNEGNGSDGR